MKWEGSRFWEGVIMVVILLIIGWILEVIGGVIDCLNFVFYLIVSLFLIKTTVILERISKKKKEK